MPTLRIATGDRLNDLVLMEDAQSHCITVVVVAEGKGFEGERLAQLDQQGSARLVKYFEKDRRPGGMLSRS